MLMILTFALTRRVWTDHPDRNGLCGLTLALSGVLMTQIGLGIGSYLILIHHFATIPPPFYAPAFITAHVATGALFLGLSMILALVSYRTRPAATPPIQTTFADYFTLTKPGISFMAGITALAGFVLGSAGDVHFARLINTCVGVLLAAGGAGTLNMLIERDIDGRMKRTQNRPLPSGRLNPGEVLFLGVLMSTVGVAYLSWTVNALAAVLTGVTVSVYLYVYTPLKKISTACVTVGAVAGALPPVVGWAAATGKIGFEALALFGIVFFWQYPHFLSLAWLYKEDYERGGLHVVSPEERSTAMSVLLTSVGLLVVSVAPSLLNLTGRIYFVAAAACGGAMLVYAIRFFAEPSRIHAKKIFLFSLAYVPLLVVLMLLNGPSGVWTY
ncbi:MAG: protoheme IX farnesyltransferase [Elusimicrobia bacterium]|nr:protoheme IX farnesyltransferase [Elusimicrobiota bacterium]